ncbi:MAG: IPExxxVDY family protein [Bacteroidota bacterium]
MKKNQLVLDDYLECDFALIGISSSIEMYRLAFLINRELGISLKRLDFDIDYHYDNKFAFYPIYEYYSKEIESEVFLVANKHISKSPKTNSTGSLFSENNSLEIKYLMPEFKQLDYLIKIEEENDSLKIKKILIDLNNIKQIASAYFIENKNVKSPENLIFY